MATPTTLYPALERVQVERAVPCRHLGCRRSGDPALPNPALLPFQVLLLHRSLANRTQTRVFEVGSNPALCKGTLHKARHNQLSVTHPPPIIHQRRADLHFPLPLQYAGSCPGTPCAGPPGGITPAAVLSSPPPSWCASHSGLSSATPGESRLPPGPHARLLSRPLSHEEPHRQETTTLSQPWN